MVYKKGDIVKLKNGKSYTITNVSIDYYLELFKYYVLDKGNILFFFEKDII